MHGEGDYLGEPFVIEPFQRFLLRRLFLVNADTRRRLVRRALFVGPKGWGKSELIAAVGLVELAGPSGIDLETGRPSVRLAPNVPIAAASYDQANELFGPAHIMASHRDSGLRPFVEALSSEIRLRDRQGKLFRVAAEAGTKDGGRPTAFGADELHEWTGAKARVHLVIGNSLTKRAEGLELNISTPDDAQPDSLLGKLVAYGEKVASGEIVDPTFLYVRYAADEHWDLDDPVQLRNAIREATPPAPWIDVDRVAARYEIDQIAEHEFRRYHLGQFVRPKGSWLPAGKWADLEVAEPRQLQPGEPVVLGFDGSYNRDATGLMACALDGHLEVLGVWERPDNALHDWVVPRSEVDAWVDRAFKRFKVVEMACDPHRWTDVIERWMERYGEAVVEFPTNTPRRMAPACSRFYGAVVNGEGLTHDGNPVLSRHLHNAVVKETRDGAYITKEHRDSPRKIDLAVAAVMAYDRAMWHSGNRPKKAVALVIGGEDA